MNTHLAAADSVRLPVPRTLLLRRPEMLVFAGLIAWFSGSVLFGSFRQSMIFVPAAVNGGEWWRLFTHPFVHVTWYHLLLDASAFFLLYDSLLEGSTARRLAFVLGSAAGSLLLSWLAILAISPNGLCGLSGIAHGLMAVSAVEMLTSQPRHSSGWKIGAFTFALVVGKAAFEAISGKVLFGFLHFGLMGDPIAVSHAGGIVGGLLAMLLMRFVARERNGVKAEKWRQKNGALGRWRPDFALLPPPGGLSHGGVTPSRRDACGRSVHAGSRVLLGASRRTRASPRCKPQGRDPITAARETEVALLSNSRACWL